MKFSEVGQDIFALETSKNKTYIEIGSARPITLNNTYLLEKNGWNGFGIEYDRTHEDAWRESGRINKIYFDDALNFDYRSAIEENGLSTRVGYLSVDINPPSHTFQALKRIIDTGLSFDCITFEHDKYLMQQNNFEDFEVIAKNFLTSNGYKVAVDNVYTIKRRRKLVDGIPSREKVLTNCHFETWFVNNDLTFDTVDYSKWAIDHSLHFN